MTAWERSILTVCITIPMFHMCFTVFIVFIVFFVFVVYIVFIVFNAFMFFQVFAAVYRVKKVAGTIVGKPFYSLHPLHKPSLSSPPRTHSLLRKLPLPSLHPPFPPLLTPSITSPHISPHTFPSLEGYSMLLPQSQDTFRLFSCTTS